MSHSKMIVKSLLLVAILSVQLTSSKAIYAQQTAQDDAQMDYFEEGQMFFDSYNYDIAIKYWQRAIEIEEIDTRAYYWIGHGYHHGLGVEQDDRLAFYFYRLAFNANDKHVFGIDLWYEFYNKGKDYVSASHNLALLYLAKKTEEGYQQAVKYFEISAWQTKNIPAYFQLALFYYQGVGVEKDIQRATAYFEIVHNARREHYIEAKIILARIYRNGEAGEVDKGRARALTEELAKEDNAEGLYYLGGAFYNGGAIEQDYERAFEYFKRSAEKNYVPSYYFVAKMYLNGEGVQTDYPKAHYWYEKSAQYGHVRAYLPLAKLYQAGLGVAENDKKAFHYLSLAKNSGNIEVDFQLAMMHYFGASVTPNARLASEYFKRAAYNGHLLAQYNLATLYRHGIGVRQNYPLAWVWYIIAAEGGNEKSAQEAEAVMKRLNPAEKRHAQTQLDKWFADIVINLH